MRPVYLPPAVRDPKMLFLSYYEVSAFLQVGIIPKLLLTIGSVASGAVASTLLTDNAVHLYITIPSFTAFVAGLVWDVTFCAMFLRRLDRSRTT